MSEDDNNDLTTGPQGQKSAAAVTSIARAARDGVLRAAASFRSGPVDDGANVDDVDASLIDGGEQGYGPPEKRQIMDTPQGPSASTEDDDSDLADEDEGSPQPASPPGDNGKHVEGPATRSGSASRRSSSPVDLACSSLISGRQHGEDDCVDDDNRTGAFTTASAATGIIENAFRVMFASCTTGENKNINNGGANTAIQDAGLAPTWGVAPARSRSAGSGDRRSTSRSRSRSSSRRKQRPSEVANDSERAEGSGGGSNASSDERHRKQLEGMRRAQQEELMRSMRGADGGNLASPKDAAAMAGNGAILSDPGAIARLLQEEGDKAVTLNDDGRMSVGDDGESYCYDDGISALTGLTLEEMERQARMEREVQKRKERQEQQRSKGAAATGGDVAAQGNAFDASFIDPRVLFPTQEGAQGPAAVDMSAPTNAGQGATPPSTKAHSAISNGEDYAASEVDDKLGQPPSPFDLSRGRSNHTHGSRRTQGSKISRSSSATSSQSSNSNEFEAAWRRDEAKYWAEEAAREKESSDVGGDANEPGLQLEVDDTSGNKGGIAPLPRPPGSRNLRAARMDMANLEKSPSRSLRSARSTEMTAPTQELTAEPSTVHDASAASGTSCSAEHHSVVEPSPFSKPGSADATTSFFDQNRHPHDTLPALDRPVAPTTAGNGSGSISGMSGGTGGAKKSKRKKKKKSRGMRLHESFVRKGARLIRAGGYYEQHEEDEDEELARVGDRKGRQQLCEGTVEGTNVLLTSSGEVAEI